jgi:hypothetical protein
MDCVTGNPAPWGSSGRRFKSCQPDVVTSTYVLDQGYRAIAVRFSTWGTGPFRVLGGFCERLGTDVGRDRPGVG